MSAQHTPGPWNVAETLNTQHTPVHTLVKTAFGGHIAACFYGSHDEERVANARLIAAVPEAIAALADLLNRENHLISYIATSPERHARHVAIVDRARAALAKLKGGGK